MPPNTDEQSKAWVEGWTTLCFGVVALTAPGNLILGLFCWGMLAKTIGSHFADNSGGALVLVLVLVQTGLFALLWLPVSYLSRRWSVGLRCVVVVVLTVLYLGFWFGWSALVIAEIARTGMWL
jgi:hypothetical protein